MPLLRRTRPTASVDTAEAPPDRPSGKGRPTPKRREAERSRRRVVPRNRREAEKLRRERVREERRRQRQALLTGDERYLPPRDRGPARRLARDIVDSRFTLGQYALVMLFVLFFLSGSANLLVGLIGRILLLIVAAVVFGQAWRLGTQAQRRVAEQYGPDAARGIRSYVFWRALSARRMRRPPPKVERGAKV